MFWDFDKEIKEATQDMVQETIKPLIEKQVEKTFISELRQLHKQLRYNYKQRFKDAKVVTLQLLKEDDNYWYVSADYSEGKLHKKDSVKMGDSKWLVSESILIEKCLDSGAT